MVAPRILCIGIPVRDLTFRVASVPNYGSKANATHFEEICGGNALNAAIAIARLGGLASLAGPIGDQRGTSNGVIFDQLAREGIASDHLQPMPGVTTPVSAIMIDAAGERTLVIYRDPALWTVMLPDPDPLLRDCDAILVESRCASFCMGLCEEARRRDIPVVVGVDRAMTLHDPLFAVASHLLFASEQLQETAGIAEDGAALRRLADITSAFLAGTRGARGTIWLSPDGALQETRAFPVRAVDTLGAGDVFQGAFTLQIAAGGGLQEALRFASAAAALKCSRFGGALAAPQRLEVEELLAAARPAGPSQPPSL